MDPHAGDADRHRLRAVRAWGAALIACGALLLAGCGSSTLSSGQLRHRATRICTSAQQRSESIAAPSEPGKASRFLRRGIAALAPQVTALHRLQPPSELVGDYDSALHSSDRELSLMRSALRALNGGEDPVTAIKTLQRDIDPAEEAAAGAWHAVGVPACTEVMG